MVNYAGNPLFDGWGLCFQLFSGERAGSYISHDQLIPFEAPVYRVITLDSFTTGSTAKEFSTFESAVKHIEGL